METAEAIAFAAVRHEGVLATIRGNGRPQLSNIIYVMDGTGLARISVVAARAKTANLRRDRRASLYVVGDDFWHYVVLECTALLGPVAASPDDEAVNDLVDLYRAVRGEHPDWGEFRRVMVEEHRLVLRLRTERAYGMLE